MPLPENSNDVLPSCAVLVSSCDAYSDLWRPFFTLLKRHWADCPFPIYLGTGSSHFAESKIQVLHSDGGRDWSKCMADYLDAINEDYVIVLLDDFFLRKDVDQRAVEHCLRFAREHAATQVRLMPRPGPTDRIPGEKMIGSAKAGSPFRVSTQGAIWDRRKLLALIKPGESIWEFELHGNERANAIRDGFYSTWKPVLPYQGMFAHHVVEKGKWLLHERWLWSRRNIGCDFTRRRTMNWAETLDYQSVMAIYHGLNFLPWRVKRVLLSGVRAVLRPFIPKPLKTSPAAA
ncbi:MAG TPA: hypothetical protein VIM69_07865 [Opitutaceae bacterium]